MKGFSQEGIPQTTLPSQLLSENEGNGRLQFVDIGANLIDDMFQGIYNDKKKHESDLHAVLERAVSMGVSNILVTGGSIQDSSKAMTMSRELRGFPNYPSLFSTVGVHPTNSNEFCGREETVLDQLSSLIEDGLSDGTVVAFGECGLDYDRLEFCAKDAQLSAFRHQIALAEKYKLPMFLHSRNTGGDFIRIVTENRSRIHGGCVHSFTGTIDEMRALINLDFMIGINGCSLKTQDNIDVVREIPEDRILLETDAPWCGIKPTHNSKAFVQTNFPCKKKEKFEPGFMVKDRCEPANIIQVFEAVAAIKGIGQDDVDSLRALASKIERNTVTCFPLIRKDL